MERALGLDDKKKKENIFSYKLQRLRYLLPCLPPFCIFCFVLFFFRALSLLKYLISNYQTTHFLLNIFNKISSILSRSSVSGEGLINC